ncbi:alpha/beta hydrolase family protein [Streptococcus sp. KHUD_018]
MKITDKNYNDIVDGVYNVDAGKVKRPWRDDKIFKSNGQTFRVLKTQDNTSNGMQAMAVAPVDKNGNVDYSHVVIAYAGTNKDDIKDLETDAQSLGLGRNNLQSRSGLNSAKVVDSQFVTALNYAKEVEEEVRQKHPSAKITTAGHSLGESLAMYVALKRGYANVGYNGPDIHNLISKEEIKYMQEHPEQFRNYRHKYDVIGNITGNTTQTAIYPYIYPAKDNWGDKLEYHNLSQWKFDENGQLVDLDGKRITNLKVTALAEATAGMYRYQKIKSYLSADGLSSKEEIYLDSLQGMALGEGMANAARAGADDIKHLQEEVVSKVQDLWNQLDFSSFRYLGYDEVLSTFASVGVTQDTIVGSVEQDFEQVNQKAEKLATEFASLNQQIIQVIENKLATDKELAGEFRKWNSRI